MQTFLNILSVILLIVVAFIAGLSFNRLDDIKVIDSRGNQIDYRIKIDRNGTKVIISDRYNFNFEIK